MFSPRVGLVWDPKGDGKQTIRAAFALMHDTTELFYPGALDHQPSVRFLDYAHQRAVLQSVASYVSPTGKRAIRSRRGDLPDGRHLYQHSAEREAHLYDAVEPQLSAADRQGLAGDAPTTWAIATSHIWGSADINPAIYIARQARPATTNAAARDLPR